MNRFPIWWLPLLAVTFVAPMVRGASITLSAGSDNTIFSESDTLSNGAGQRFFAGNTAFDAPRRGLLRFDFAGLIYAGAAIDSVVLRLNVVKAQPVSGVVTLHRALASWGEGTSIGSMGEGGGAPATPNDATWTQRFFGSAQPWTSPGGDYVASASASRAVLNNGAYEWRSAGMSADVAFWLANPAQNFGWELKGDEASASTAKAFASRQNSVSNIRPLLTVYYTIPTSAGPSPYQTRLFSARPNPFNPITTIRYELAATQWVTIHVYDATGRLVRTLVDGVEPAGSHELVWRGDEARGGRVASGVYLVKLSAANTAIQTMKVVLLK